MWVGTLSLFFPGALGANNGSQSKCFWLQWARGNSTQWAQKWKLMMSSPESDGSRGPGLTVFFAKHIRQSSRTCAALLRGPCSSPGPSSPKIRPPACSEKPSPSAPRCLENLSTAWNGALYSYNPSLLTTCPAIERPAVGSWWREGADGSQSSRNFSLVWWTGSQKTLPKG